MVLSKKKDILPYILDFYRDNDIKLKLVRGKKDILTKEVKSNQSQKNVSLKKVYFWGHPVIQGFEAIMLGPFYKIHIHIYKIFCP